MVMQRKVKKRVLRKQGLPVGVPELHSAVLFALSLRED